MTVEAIDSDNSGTRIVGLRISKILVPIDGSEFTLNAVKYVIKIANYEKAQMMCIHVITTTVLVWSSSTGD